MEGRDERAESQPQGFCLAACLSPCPPSQRLVPARSPLAPPAQPHAPALPLPRRLEKRLQPWSMFIFSSQLTCCLLPAFPLFLAARVAGAGEGPPCVSRGRNRPWSSSLKPQALLRAGEQAAVGLALSPWQYACLLIQSTFQGALLPLDSCFGGGSAGRR